MRFTINRNDLLKPLQMVIGAIEKRQTMPILANVLLSVINNTLSMTCTDLEIELVSNIALESSATDGSITVSGRKLLDICRVLPDGATIAFDQETPNRVVVKANKSRYVLSALPAEEFPNVDWLDEENLAEFSMPQQQLLHLLESTQFAMAQQDVRYYLNGLLLEIKDGMIWAAATDGHRLALNGINAPVINSSLAQVIIPRKGITELMRLLDDSEDEMQVSIGKNHIRITKPGLIFTSKLIDGKFPDYDKAIPKDGNKDIIVDREAFKQALTRVAILSNDLFKGVRLQINSGLMKMFTSTQDQEEAEEEIAIDYQGEDISTGFNITYLLDVLSHSAADRMCIKIKDGMSSALLDEHESKGNKLYVVMPLRF